jgi:hypothetical protein
MARDKEDTLSKPNDEAAFSDGTATRELWRIAGGEA